jgi:hypothetical protein
VVLAALEAGHLRGAEATRKRRVRSAILDATLGAVCKGGPARSDRAPAGAVRKQLGKHERRERHQERAPQGILHELTSEYNQP